VDQERGAEYWETHCWARRFQEDEGSPRCEALATHQGPPNSPSQFVRAWRACDQHHLTTDVPLANGEAR